MRKNRENQLPLSPTWPDHRLARELESISKILDQNPSISDLVLHNLCDKVSSKNGARGMTAEQVLRCALIKQTHQFSYEKLAFHLIDSQRHLLPAPLSQIHLQENISRIEASTCRQSGAGQLGWKKGVRFELPPESKATSAMGQLLYDSIRVVTRLLKRLNPSESLSFVDHSRRAKKRCLNIRNSRGEKRKKHYQDLLKIAGKTLGYGTRALEQALQWQDPISPVLAEGLAHHLDLMGRVIQQISGDPWARKKRSSPSLKNNRHYRRASLGLSECSAVLMKGNPADSQQLEPLLQSLRALPSPSQFRWRLWWTI